MHNAQEIVDCIKSELKKQGRTTKDMLVELNMGINTISELSKGKQMSYFGFAKIADYLNCSVDYLLGRTDAPQNTLGDDFSPHEKELVAAYRNKPEMQESIDKLLDISVSSQKSNMNIRQFADRVKSMKDSGELMTEDKKIAAFDGRRDVPKNDEEKQQQIEFDELRERIIQLEKKLLD